MECKNNCKCMELCEEAKQEKENEAKEEPREFTQKEVRENFLFVMLDILDTWQDKKGKAKEKLEGMMLDVLRVLDGHHPDLPVLELIPNPLKDDKEYSIKNGKNYYRPFEPTEDMITVHDGSYALHNELYYLYYSC